jgi:hypothetical protein
MKAVFSLLSLFILSSACNSTTNKISTEANGHINQSNAEIAFDDKDHDFGTLVEGDVVFHSYKFKNVGTDPLQVMDVQVSCGCTVAAKPEKPVGVGQGGEIKIQFNSKGKVGTNKKSIGVISNAKNNQEILNFTAVVTAKPETE